MSIPDRDIWYEFQNEDIDEARLLTADADRLYACGAAGDDVLCLLSSQSNFPKFRQFSVPVLDLYSGWNHNEEYSELLAQSGRHGLPADAFPDALPVKILFYSSRSSRRAVAMAGLLRIGGVLEAPNKARKGEWYEFRERDLHAARMMTQDADCLYAAGQTGDLVLTHLAMQSDTATFGKKFRTQVLKFYSDRWRAEIADAAFLEKARQGLPIDAPRNVFAVEVVFISSIDPEAPPTRMASILHVGAMLGEVEEVNLYSQVLNNFRKGIVK